MAGRPLRHLRSNPLVEFDRQYSGTMGSAAYYHGPLLRADATERFRARMAVSDLVLTARGLMPLPLTIIIPDSDLELDVVKDYARRKGAETKSVALVEFIEPRWETSASKPGTVSRETPHTLFNVLHRLCEFISSDPGRNTKYLRKRWTGDFVFLSCVPSGVYHNFIVAVNLLGHGASYLESVIGPRRVRSNESSDWYRALLCSGLNTASGRMSAINSPDQALAEAFAKFCLSTDTVYDPSVPLHVAGQTLYLDSQHQEHIQVIRQIWATVLKQTVHSICRVFGLFVKGYYEDLDLPLPKMPEHVDTLYESMNNMLRARSLDTEYTNPTFKVEFVCPGAFADTLHAQQLLHSVIVRSGYSPHNLPGLHAVFAGLESE